MSLCQKCIKGGGSLLALGRGDAIGQFLGVAQSRALGKPPELLYF